MPWASCSMVACCQCPTQKAGCVVASKADRSHVGMYWCSSVGCCWPAAGAATRAWTSAMTVVERGKGRCLGLCGSCLRLVLGICEGLNMPLCWHPGHPGALLAAVGGVCASPSSQQPQHSAPGGTRHGPGARTANHAHPGLAQRSPDIWRQLQKAPRQCGVSYRRAALGCRAAGQQAPHGPLRRSQQPAAGRKRTSGMPWHTLRSGSMGHAACTCLCMPQGQPRVAPMV